jgi:hypothetical protein
VKGSFNMRDTVLKYAKPIKAEGMAIPVTHPVCSPKYMLLKQMATPIAKPHSTPRRVKFCGWEALSARNLSSPEALELDLDCGASRFPWSLAATRPPETPRSGAMFLMDGRNRDKGSGDSGSAHSNIKAIKTESCLLEGEMQLLNDAIASLFRRGEARSSSSSHLSAATPVTLTCIHTSRR